MRCTLILLVALPLAAMAAEPGPLVRLGSDRFRQAERATAIAYSADGKRLATADEQNVYVWDAADGRLLRTISISGQRSFLTLQFSVDATSLFAVGMSEKRDASLYQLNPENGKVVAADPLVDEGKGDYFGPAAQFSLDGAWVAARRRDGRQVVVMNTATRKVVWSGTRPDEKFFSLAFRADGQILAIGQFDGQVQLVDLKSGRVTHQYAVGDSIVWDLSFMPDGSEIVACVNARDGGETQVVRFAATNGDTRWISRMQSAGKLFVTATGSAVVYFGRPRKSNEPYRWHWLDAATGKALDRSMDTGWQEPALRRDGKVLALGGQYGHISQWDLTTRKRLDDKSADPGLPVAELSFIPDGGKVRGWANGWYEWDVKTGKQTRLSPPLDIGASETTVGSPDLKWLVRGHQLIDLTDVGTRNWKLIGFYGQYRFLADNRLVIGKGSELTVYNPRTLDIAKPLARIEADGGAAAVSVDGKAAIAIRPVGNHFHATRYDLTTGKPIGEWEGRLPDSSLMDKSHDWRAALSPDGRILAVFFNHLAHPGNGFDRIEALHTALFDARTGRYLSGWWDLHFQADLAFSPDGRMVACYYPSGLGVDIREVATGERRTRRSNPPIHSAAFSPDGRRLALATGPTPVALWDLVGRPGGPWADQKPANLWAGLASENAELVFDVIRTLRHHPAEAVAFLKERVKVPTAPAAEWVAGRIKALDAPQFRDRERATADLAGAGELIVPELRAALKTASPEARRRLEGLLEKATTPSRETWRAIRVCEVLEGIGAAEAREVLATWAKGLPAATLTREATESVERLAKRR
jgi:WD40 repeat protein